MNKPKLPKPTLKQFNNKFPHDLCEVNTRDGVTKFIPRSAIDDEIWVDECICIDSRLGIYARCLQVDTVFLERDPAATLVEFIEC